MPLLTISVKMVRAEFAQTKLIVNPKNVGFAAANNQGMVVASGRYVLLLDSDHDRSQWRGPKIGRVCRQPSGHRCPWMPDIESGPQFAEQLLHVSFASQLVLIFHLSLPAVSPESFFGREQMTWWSRNDSREVDVVTGCYMLVRRAAIDDVGLMDDGFFMYAEETDWCYRFKAKGWENRFTPDASIVHIGGASAAKLGASRAQVTNASFARYMFKHWSIPRAAAGMFMIFLFYFLRLMVLLPKWLLKHDARDEKLLQNHWAGLKDITMNYYSRRQS